MTLNIGSRDKKFLIGGGIFITCYFFFILVGQPVYEKQILSFNIQSISFEWVLQDNCNGLRFRTYKMADV